MSALEHEKRRIPNLERQLVTSPVLFVQAVCLVYMVCTAAKSYTVSTRRHWIMEEQPDATVKVVSDFLKKN
jgi:hypothetical protein